MSEYYILSVQYRHKQEDWHYWWMPDSQGYTSNIAMAGKYSWKEAKEICDNCSEVFVVKVDEIDDFIRPIVRKGDINHLWEYL